MTKIGLCGYLWGFLENECQIIVWYGGVCLK